MGQQQFSTRIETDRLVLRPLRMGDAVDVAYLIDRQVAEMTSGVPYPASKAMVEDFLSRMEEAGSAKHRSFVIADRRAGPIGVLGFHHTHGVILELGFWLGAAFRGRGLATEAVSAAMTWVCDSWGRRAIASGHFIDNPASARVLDKAGFLYTGVVEAQYSHGRDCDVDSRLMIWLA